VATPTGKCGGVRSSALSVALVCMPFSAADRPSIQIGLLAAIARQHGFVAETHHLNLELAAHVGPNRYDALCRHRGRMTGEWLFSVAAFGDAAGNDDAFFSAFPEEVAIIPGDKEGTWLSALRHEVLPAYVDACIRIVDWRRYDVVGFTSTFQQNLASLALARRIKERCPEITIVIGGANMEDEMGPEHARAFPFVDYVVVGEADRVFPALLKGLEADSPPVGLAGLVSRTRSGVQHRGSALPVQQLDALPTPMYDEYFTRAARLGLAADPHHQRALPFESSRGCWWGQKHHCTFCGLNGLGMGFRSKSPERILRELAELSRRHGVTCFAATDNILDMKHVEPLFGAIANASAGYQFFYEIKANLSRAQIRQLYDGGVRWVQPGIESLSSHVLRLMNKGSTMLQNLRLLKWCRHYGIRVSWNLIWGFPGETAADYEHELAVLRLLSHLEPPQVCTRIWLERFSPYFFDRKRFPVRDVRPEASYRFAYAGSAVDLEKAAYFFDYVMDETLPDQAHAATQAWVSEWQCRHVSTWPATLTYRRIEGEVTIDDSRDPFRPETHCFDGVLADSYELCSETMRTPAQVVAQLGDEDEQSVRVALETLCTRGFMVTEDDRYLSLALPADATP
jgi:ribosomal peptide maturation radical SAM protein 1